MTQRFINTIKISALLCGFALAGCGTVQNSGYFSESEYESYNCNQLQAELKLVKLKYDQKRNEEQQKQIFNAAISMMGPTHQYGSNASDDQELVWLKQQQDILEHMQIKKDCIH